MPGVKTISVILVTILFTVFVSFVILGFSTTIPYSQDNNVPIAKSIASGEFINLQAVNPYEYYPGSSHSFMIPFLYAGIPNLFGLLSWIVLFIVAKKLGDTFGLSKSMSIIFAASICTTTSVIRTIGDQSIDKWLCSWFILSIILLEKPKRNWTWSLLIGFTLGMLIGTKYSGPLFLLPLFIVYGKTLLSYLYPMRFISAGIMFTIFGLFWYIRNFIVKGNPFYPANTALFEGAPTVTVQDWHVWKIPFIYPEGVIALVNSFFSEYLIWAFSGILIIWYLIYSKRKKEKFDSKIKRLVLLGVTTGLVCLLLPITPPYKIELFHIVSNMRYLYILMVILILVVFLISDKFKKNNLLATLVILNAAPLYSFIPYQPKIFIAVMLLFILFYFKNGMVSKLFNKF